MPSSTFQATVMHWNVLARYLGRNTNPWFLHGIQLDRERRSAVMRKYAEWDPRRGTARYAGWPSYVEGILTPSESARVEAVDAQYFAWERRFPQIVRRLESERADVVSLVELDEYDALRRRLAAEYDSAFAPRPRPVSKDGCAIFWRRSEFSCLATKSVVFQDRSALLVLLQPCGRHVAHLPSIIFASTHLARDSDTKAGSRDAVRARQLLVFASTLRAFALESGPSADLQTPVVLCGDLNATSLAKLQGTALASALLGGVKVHPFLFQTQPLMRRGSTSFTELRDVRIDTILYSSSRLDADAYVTQRGESHAAGGHNGAHIPDADTPSDHYPLLARLGLKTPEHRRFAALTRWWSTVVRPTGPSSPPLPPPQRPATLVPPSSGSQPKPSSPSPAAVAAADNTEAPDERHLHHQAWLLDVQMDAEELAVAYQALDRDGDGAVSERDAFDSLVALDLLPSWPAAHRREVARSAACRDFADFCALYYMVHPTAAQCATEAFDQIDQNPRDGFVTLDEVEHFFESFVHVPMHGDAARRTFDDAATRGFCVDGRAAMDRAGFQAFLGARFVELAFEPQLAHVIIARMRAATASGATPLTAPRSVADADSQHIRR